MSKKVVIGILIGVLIIGITFGAVGFAKAHNNFGNRNSRAKYGMAFREGKEHMTSNADALAEFLGISKNQLMEERKSGKTLVEIAKEHGKTAEELKNFLVNNANSRIDALLKEGKITKEQYENIKEHVSERISEMVSGKENGMFGLHRGMRGNAHSGMCGDREGDTHRGFGRRQAP